MRQGLLAAAAAQIGNFLLEPAEGPRAEPAEPVGARGAAVAANRGSAPVAQRESARVPLSPPGPRPVVAVFGLARRCGATVVARALAAELAARDPEAVAAVASERRAGGIPLATLAAGRLAATLADVPGATTTAVGRLCLVEGAERLALAEAARALAPLVIDAGTTEVEGEPATVADRVLLVSAPGIEPALAAAAAACVQRFAGEAVIVLNRAASNAEPPGGAGIVLPASRMGAQLALGGRQARGELGRAIGALADICGAAK